MEIFRSATPSCSSSSKIRFLFIECILFYRSTAILQESSTDTLSQIKAGVKKMIEKTMRRVIEDELSEGYPLALPSILELDSADIRYYEVR